MAKTTIYQFRFWDQTKGEILHSQAKATMAAIKTAKGVPNLETAEEVDPADLDGNGFYRSPELTTTQQPANDR